MSREHCCSRGDRCDIGSRCDPMSHQSTRRRRRPLRRARRDKDNEEQRNGAGQVVPPPPSPKVRRCWLCLTMADPVSALLSRNDSDDDGRTCATPTTKTSSSRATADWLRCLDDDDDDGCASPQGDSKVRRVVATWTGHVIQRVPDVRNVRLAPRSRPAHVPAPTGTVTTGPGRKPVPVVRVWVLHGCGPGSIDFDLRVTRAHHYALGLTSRVPVHL